MTKNLRTKSKRFFRAIRSGKRPYALAAFSILLALGVLTLIRSGPAHARGESFSALRPLNHPAGNAQNATNGNMASQAAKAGITASFGLSQGLVPANAAQNVFAEMIIKGEAGDTGARVPAAIAVVLDHSGSMSGVKLTEAKNALQQLVENMQSDDHVAVVIYDDAAEVRLPLARVGDVRSRIGSVIASIREGGGTNIPAGLELGLQALQSAPTGAVKRVVLFSDGLDGSGRQLSEIEGRIRSFSAQGTAVSALGIGTDYDEAYMSKVAQAGSGNYGFLANRQMLQRFVKLELDETANTVADQVVAQLNLPDGATVGRVVGATHDASQSTLTFGPVAAGAERRAVVEIKMPARASGIAQSVGYKLGFRNVKSNEMHSLQGSALKVASSSDSAAISASRNVEVWSNATAAFVDLDQEAAIKAWEAGDADKAREITKNNMAVLGGLASARKSANLAPSAAVSLQRAEYQKDEGNFGNAPESKEARAYQKFSKAKRRARGRSSAASTGKGYSADDALGELTF